MSGSRLVAPPGLGRKPPQVSPKPEAQPAAPPATTGEAAAAAGSPTGGKAPALPTKPPAPTSPTKAEQQAKEKERQAAERKKSRSGKLSRASSIVSQVSARVPRVYPTYIVLKGDDGEELWRSSELLLGENMRAAELLSRDSSQRFSMPQEFADMIQADTHELFVLDTVSGELLQIANLASTNLQSLQRHAVSDGKLTLVISPLEDSEDAFETV